MVAPAAPAGPASACMPKITSNEGSKYQLLKSHKIKQASKQKQIN